MEDKKRKNEYLHFSSRNDHFLCKKCFKTPKLQIDEINQNFIVQCCQKDNGKSLIDLKILKEDYILESDEEDILKCKDHYNDFNYHCQICMKDFCEKCKKCTHKKINLDTDDLKEYIKKLKIIFFKDEEKKKKDNDSEEEEEIMIESITKMNINNDSDILKRIISIIINDFLTAKNYNLEFCIQNLSNYYEKHPPKNFENNTPEFTINSPNDLENSEKITKIEIYQYCFDLNKLNVSLPNLSELYLRNNNIYDVEILIKCNFKHLKKLYLDNNKIDDKILNQMKEMKFEELEILSLKQNYLTNYAIFNEIKVFTKLKSFDISSNLFKNKEFFDNRTIELNNIEELILSNGVFDDSSIDNISNIKLEKLKLLDLSCNNLSSLKFIHKSHWPNLNTLLLNENDIVDLTDLINKFNDFEGRINIIIENNLIKDENQINELIEKNNKIGIKYKLDNEILEADNDKNNPSTDITY